MGELYVRIRRLLLELAAMLAVACVIGFLGPFGTFLDGPFVYRVEQWWLLLMGAYLLVRPSIVGFSEVAERLKLPMMTTVTGGVVALSAPLAYVWRSVGQNAYRELNGYAELVPFSLLCALTVLAIVLWAANIDRRLAAQATSYALGEPSSGALEEPAAPAADQAHLLQPPRLFSRLSPGFLGPIVALQSEDHYVRVYGLSGSELVLMRLREAIAEMGEEPGDQIHRSWWVARAGIAHVERSGRSWSVHLVNGEAAPVSRDAIYRLRQGGLLPLEDSA
jgi:hypothetical protein